MAIQTRSAPVELIQFYWDGASDISEISAWFKDGTLQVSVDGKLQYYWGLDMAGTPTYTTLALGAGWINYTLAANVSNGPAPTTPVFGQLDVRNTPIEQNTY